MLTVLKPFFKYDFFLALLLILLEVIIRLQRDGISFVFILCIYIPILLVVAPILFGIRYGRSVSRNHTLSFPDRLKLSGIIFVVSYITYLLPYFEWNFKFTKMLLRIAPYTLLPSLLITVVLFCSLYFYNNKNKKSFQSDTSKKEIKK